MDFLQFNGVTKEGKYTFHPKVVYGFEDPDAAEYFKTMGWAEEAKGPADVTVTVEELDIDPEVVWADGPNQGLPVMPARAAEARRAREAQEA